MSKIVLAVDDDGEIVRFVQLCLEREGFHVSTAYNGRDALNHVAQQKPNPIVLNWTMPDDVNPLDGWINASTTSKTR